MEPETSIVITSENGMIEAHDGWERPPTPEMMPVRYDKWDGWTPQEIADHLATEQDSRDPNLIREEQIEQLEGLITGLDFWPAAHEVFCAEQTRLASEINYTGGRRKHERRSLETILSQVHEELKTTKRDRGSD